jgi:uncharacterized DUF497 family protein
VHGDLVARLTQLAYMTSCSNGTSENGSVFCATGLSIFEMSTCCSMAGPLNHLASPRNEEERFASTAELTGKFYTVIWTWRGENRRIISFRRARNGEERAYRKVFG